MKLSPELENALDDTMCSQTQAGKARAVPQVVPRLLVWGLLLALVIKPRNLCSLTHCSTFLAKNQSFGWG